MDTLIDRYLSAVSENLPAKQRKEVVTEIRSLIQDALDDRSKAEGRAPDDEMSAAVLKEFGPPEKIVAPYLPERYLIGPHLYPSFILVLRIALPIIAILVLVTSLIGMSLPASNTTTEFITMLVKSIGNALTAAFQAFGNIVVIFAILQWVLPEFKTKTKEWNPHSLKAISKPDKIKRGELIVEIALTLVGLIIFNFYFDRIGIYNNYNGQWSFAPILTPAFNRYLPWLNLLWVLTILLDIWLIRKNSWNTLTRLFSILLSAYNIAIAVSLLSHIKLVYTLEGALGQLGAGGMLKSLLDQVLLIVLAIVIITSAVKILQMAWRLIRPGYSSASQPSV